MGRLYDAFLRKVPRQSRSRSVVEAILTAAIEGIAGTSESEDISLDRTAERAGVGIGSLYDYFHDRQGVLAGIAAKLTEDTLHAFESVLRSTGDLPLRESVERIVDHAFSTYAAKPRLSRVTLRIAHGVGLMPRLADSQTEFARSLAEMLAARSDLGPSRDFGAVAYVLTQAVMGVMHTLLWQETPPFSREVLREELVLMILSTLHHEP